MSARIIKLAVYVAFLLGCIYLALVDYSSRLETDVESLLPQVQTEEARLARKLISEEQGRIAYVEVVCKPEDARAVDERLQALLKDHRLLDTVTLLDHAENRKAFEVVSKRRIELLLPGWVSQKRLQFAQDGSDLAFPEWAAESAARDLDSFLESPAAMELARPELMDPLLLLIGNLLALSEGEGGAMFSAHAKEELGVLRYWLTLAVSPFPPHTQDEFAALMSSSKRLLSDEFEDLDFRYGGLIRIATASRTRIQADVFKINLFSILGVGLVAVVLLRKPWKLLLALPTLLAAGVGALAISFLVFEQINVIVLVVGAILIGTAIDYAIHLLFASHAKDDFPTYKLVAYACFSTVMGFSILLFAELELIRQIGVFVGGGLFCAYAMARVSLPALECGKQSAMREVGPMPQAGLVAGAASACLLVAGAFGLSQVKWKDDIRNLEAPDDVVLNEDLALRGRLGSSQEGYLFLTVGDSFLDVFEKESRLIAAASSGRAEAVAFGASSFLPSASQVKALEGDRERVATLARALRAKLDEAGYEMDSFERFFAELEALLEEGSHLGETVERGIGDFRESLAGPVSGLFGVSGEQFWSLSSVRLSAQEAMRLSNERPESVLFSQLTFLNKTLDHFRVSLMSFGGIALAAVVVVILLVFGWRKGLLAVLFPAGGGLIAVGMCSVLFGGLNMFHLVGCFLGGAIALDYALFAIESFARREPIPGSVWLSAWTTAASFFALALSSIPVVQGLGSMVAFLALSTLLLLYSLRPALTKLLQK